MSIDMPYSVGHVATTWSTAHGACWAVHGWGAHENGPKQLQFLPTVGGGPTPRFLSAHGALNRDGRACPGRPCRCSPPGGGMGRRRQHRRPARQQHQHTRRGHHCRIGSLAPPCATRVGSQKFERSKKSATPPTLAPLHDIRTATPLSPPFAPHTGAIPTGPTLELHRPKV